MTPEHYRRLRALFDEATRKPTAEREEFIRKAAAGDPNLLRELASLVDAYVEDDDFLEPAADLLEDDPVSSDEAPLFPGEPLAHYVIEKEIGRGGMGVVYLARDTRLERPVALKALNPQLLSDPRQIERFRREARAAAALRHPAIATVYALEEHKGRFYLITEYLPGGRLAEEIGDGGISVPQALSIVRHVSEGLVEAHRQGVVHRDLKPDNIILDGTGVPKLVDFGLALVDPVSEGRDRKLTRTGFLLGTPGYISPEQLEGHPADSRSDQFALGVLLIELVTGRNPFLRSSVAATIAAVLGHTPEIPDVLGGEAMNIVRRCLEKDPALRYPSTEELASALREAERPWGSEGAARVAGGGRIEGGPSRSRPGRSPENAGPETGLHRYWWNFHQSIVLAIYGAMIVVGWLVLDGAEPAWAGRGIFFALLAGAIGAGTLRFHLLFTWRFNSGALAMELRKSRPWLVLTDALFSLALTLGAIWIMPTNSLLAGTLAAVGVGNAFVLIFVEPSTTRAIFPDH